MTESIAKKVSLITTSFPWIIALLIFVFLKIYPDLRLSRIDLSFIALMCSWTFGCAFILKRKLNLDRKDRSHRSYFLLWIIPVWIVILIPFLFTDISRTLVDAVILATTISSVLLLNNVFYRISFHVSINTSILIILNHFANWEYWPLFLIIPIIAWSRFYLHKHTIIQLLAGALIPILTYFCLTYFELIS